MKMMMTRCVDSKMRYYTIELIRNLFDEWLLTRTYGSSKAKRPTRVMKEIYTDESEARISLESLLRAKEKKGYITLVIRNDSFA